MTNLDRLYEEVILDHNKSPRNFGEINDPTHHAQGHNPLCGDDIKIYLIINNNIVEDIKFDGEGCAISKASSSMLTTKIKGKTINEINSLIENFINLLTTDENEKEIENKIGPLKIFKGVKKYPIRVKCATLSWRALEAALNSQTTVSTE